MIKFNIEKYRKLEARAAQLNAAARLAGERYREASHDLRQREDRLRKAPVRDEPYRNPLPDETLQEIDALERDVEVAHARFEQCDRERVESQEKWNSAATLFQSCKDFLLAHGITDPDAPHDHLHTARGLGGLR